jgi:hypothetical protein
MDNRPRRLQRDEFTRGIGYIRGLDQNVSVNLQHGWAEGRRYLGLDILAKSRLTLVPNNYTQEVTETPMALSA